MQTHTSITFGCMGPTQSTGVGAQDEKKPFLLGSGPGLDDMNDFGETKFDNWSEFTQEKLEPPNEWANNYYVIFRCKTDEFRGNAFCDPGV